VLSVRAFAGRIYSQADEGRELAVASYGFWRKRLYGDPNALGQPIELNGKLYTLLGAESLRLSHYGRNETLN